MKNLVILFIFPIFFWSCDPKKDPAPDAVEGKDFVEISTPNSTIKVGETLTLTGNYTNTKGVATVPGFVWTSTSADVATVSPAGIVNALKIGQTYVIAAYLTKMDTIIVTVLPNSSTNNPTATTTTTSTTSTTTGSTTTSGVNTTVSTVLILAQTSTIQINATQQLQAQAYNSSSNSLSGKSFVWSSSDTSIIKVNSTGLITAVKSGTANITVVTEGVSSLAYSIIVSASMKSGNFSGLGSEVVNGSGILKFDAGGNLKIEFSSDFSSTSGPDLYVYLSNFSSGSQVNSKGLIIAVLGATSGARSYTVPAGTGLDDYKYLVVHCRQYAHTFGFAELK